MARTFLRQDTQVRNSDVYDDTIAPSLAAFETNPTEIETDLNNIRSMLSYLKDIQAGNWYDTQTAPSTLESGVLRGVDDLNDALHLIEKKRVLKCIWGLDSITIAVAGDTEVILGAGELPGNTTAAVGAVSTLGTVVAAHTGTFGDFSLDEVSGPTAISPKNLVQIVDAVTRDPILDAGDQIYGLLQSENASDGHTITTTTPNRVQISFVKINGSGNDLISITSGAMDGISFDYCYVERVRLEDLNEEDFLGGANVDVPSGSTVTRQEGYNNQGTTPVDVTTNSTLDLEAAGIFWEIRDDLEATLFRITEGSAGGTTAFFISADVDTYVNDALDIDFDQGISVNTGGTRPIDIGVTDGVIESTAGDLKLDSAASLAFEDSFKAGSTFTTDLVLADSSAEWDAFEAEFGEVSLLNAMVQALTTSDIVKTCANVTSTTLANNDVGGTGGGTNLDAQLNDMSGGDFVGDHDVFLNGQLLRGGADASANNDYYPGTSLALGQLRFEFTVKANDVICVISRA